MAIPVTTPVADTVPAAGLLLLQVPPPVRSVNAVVKPAHTDNVPVIPTGTGFTVTTAVVIQPVPIVYVMVAVPAVAPPVTTPVEEPIVAVPVALLPHVPPVGVSLNVVVAPEHSTIVPVIGTGNVFTVTIVVVIHPVGKV